MCGLERVWRYLLFSGVSWDRLIHNKRHKKNPEPPTSLLPLSQVEVIALVAWRHFGWFISVVASIYHVNRCSGKDVIWGGKDVIEFEIGTQSLKLSLPKCLNFYTSSYCIIINMFSLVYNNFSVIQELYLCSIPSKISLGMNNVTQIEDFCSKGPGGLEASSRILVMPW